MLQLGQIDFSKAPRKPKIYLCKPDLKRTMVGSLVEAYNVKWNIKLGGINELNFTLPFERDFNFENKRNPNIEKIKERYLIKFVYDTYTEWYTIRNIEDDMLEDGDIKTVQCFSLQYELTDKILRNIDVVSYNGQNIFQLALNETIWKIDTEKYDTHFDLMFRSFSETSITTLDFLFKIAEKFNGILLFNTHNRTIGFKKLEDLGRDRGLRFSYGKYLKSLNKKLDFDNVCTRLKVYGRNNLSIQRINPTGTDYIEDYSTIIYPFERDVNKNVITSSDYISDSLCHALLDYKELVESKRGEFTQLIADKESLQQQKLPLLNELSNLQIELAIILDRLDTANANGEDNSEIIQEKFNKQNEIEAKQSEIDVIDIQIEQIDSQIFQLKTLLSIENNFTTEEMEEWNPHINMREWSDDTYMDDEELYKAAIEKFDEFRLPKTVININVINFLEIVEAQREWHKLNIADVITIYYEKMNVHSKAKLFEIEIDFENADIRLTIANIKDLLSDEEKFIRDMYKGISSSTIVTEKRHEWGEIGNTSGKVNDILNNAWQANKRIIEAGVNESVEVSSRGIIIRNPDDPNKYLVAQHGIIALTQDGGNNWEHAMRPDGIIGKVIIGEIIAGQNLTITNEAGTFTVNNNGVMIRDMDLILTQTNNNAKIIINTTDGIRIQRNVGNNTFLDKFWVDTYGQLRVLDSRINNSINNVDISENGIIIRDGHLEINRTDEKARILIDPYSGFKIQQKSGTGWADTVFLDTDGNAIFNGKITAGSIESDTDINVNKSVHIGQFLHIDPNNFIAGIRWGIGGASPEIYYEPAGNSIIVGNVNAVYAKGQRLDNIDSIYAKKSEIASVPSSTGTAGSHNHGIPDGTVLQTAGGGTVIWRAYGGHSHSI